MTDVQQTNDTHDDTNEEFADVVCRGAPQTRRGLIAGAGALGASALLAACGTDKGVGTGGTGSTGAGTGSSRTGSGNTGSGRTGSSTGTGSGTSGALATKDEVPVGGGVIKADLVITQPTAGQYRAFSKKCTHLTCNVSEVTDTINCKCHNSSFSLTDGSVTSGPATAPLPETKVKLDGDNVVLA